MEVNDDDEPRGYRWESGYEKTWEAISLDDADKSTSGLPQNIADYIENAKRKRLEEKTDRNRLGLMRQLYIIIDGSDAMSFPDFKPTRMLCALKCLETFVEEYVTANPISQLAFVTLTGKRAEKVSDLTGSVLQHVNALNKLKEKRLQNQISLVNGLNVAVNTLRTTPDHISREILIIMAALSTCDPDNLENTIDVLVNEGIRVSVISMSAEIHACRNMAERTGGTCSAVMNDVHFRDELMAHVDPPNIAVLQDNALVQMGFPHGRSVYGKHAQLSMCICHLTNTDEPSKLTSTGYHCPQCFSKYCQLPVECQVCGLMLVTAPHLARSYHHLFPVAPFTEVVYNGQVADCYGCEKMLTMTGDRHIYRCETCSQYYCICCDVFIHDTLHSCAGCNSIRNVARTLYKKPLVIALHSNSAPIINVATVVRPLYIVLYLNALERL